MFRLDLGQMANLEKQYGSLDWRMPETHALYWSSLGLACATGNEVPLAQHAVNQALMLSVLRGRFAGSPQEKQWRAAPNLAVALSAADALLADNQKSPSSHQTIIVVRYLAKTIRLAIKAGDPELARQLYGRLGRAIPTSRQVPTFEEVVQGWGSS
jgi:hypothetical protein